MRDETAVPLKRDRSFWGMTATQFLGAFNDNVFKQLVLGNWEISLSRC